MTTTNGTAATETTKTVSNGSNLKELFAQYDAANQEVQEAKAHVVTCEYERSAIVKQIAEAIAPKKKITRGGKEMTIISRGETYYFRGPKDTNPEDVVSVD